MTEPFHLSYGDWWRVKENLKFDSGLIWDATKCFENEEYRAYFKGHVPEAVYEYKGQVVVVWPQGALRRRKYNSVNQVLTAFNRLFDNSSNLTFCNAPPPSIFREL